MSLLFIDFDCPRPRSVSYQSYTILSSFDKSQFTERAPALDSGLLHIALLQGDTIKYVWIR